MNAAGKAANRRGGKGPPRRRRSAARLAAVQAVYEIDIAGAAAAAVVREFIEERWREGDGEEKTAAGAVRPDDGLFASVVLGVAERRDELDRMIAAALSADRTLERLEAVLRAILRAGAYELLVERTVPPRVVINEYMEVAHAFFAGNEPDLVNAVLDRLARTLRPGELEVPKGERATETR